MAEQIDLQQRVEGILRPLKDVDDKTKGLAWSEAIDATSDEDFQSRFQNIQIPDDVKGQLWYLRFGEKANTEGGAIGTFFGEAKRLNPLPGAQTIWHGMQLSNRALPPETRKQYEQELYQGFVEPQVEQFRKSGEAFKKGEGGAGVTYAAAGLLPGLGPTITESGERIRSGDVAGGAGELTFGLLPSIVGRSPKTGTSIVREGVKKLVDKDAAYRLYKAALQPPASMKLKTQEAVLGEGLKHKTLPRSKKGLAEAESRNVQAVSAIDVMTDPLSISGQKLIRVGDVLGPINKKITRLKRGFDKGDAQPLIDARDKWLKDTKDEQTALGIANPGKFVTVARAQELARETDINPSVFKATAFPGKDPLANKLLVSGASEAIKRALPGIRPFKRTSHLNIALRDTIDANLRKSPAVLEKYGTWILTGHAIGVAGALATGNIGTGLKLGAGALAAMVARESVQNPNVLARLAFALNKEGITWPVSGKGAAYSAVTLGPNMEPPAQRGNEQPGETLAPPPAPAEFSPDANPFRGH